MISVQTMKSVVGSFLMVALSSAITLILLHDPTRDAIASLFYKKESFTPKEEDQPLPPPPKKKIPLTPLDPSTPIKPEPLPPGEKIPLIPLDPSTPIKPEPLPPEEKIPLIPLDPSIPITPPKKKIPLTPLDSSTLITSKYRTLFFVSDETPSNKQPLVEFNNDPQDKNYKCTIGKEDLSCNIYLFDFVDFAVPKGNVTLPKFTFKNDEILVMEPKKSVEDISSALRTTFTKSDLSKDEQLYRVVLKVKESEEKEYGPDEVLEVKYSPQDGKYEDLDKPYATMKLLAEGKDSQMHLFRSHQAYGVTPTVSGGSNVLQKNNKTFFCYFDENKEDKFPCELNTWDKREFATEIKVGKQYFITSPTTYFSKEIIAKTLKVVALETIDEEFDETTPKVTFTKNFPGYVFWWNSKKFKGVTRHTLVFLTQ